MLLKIIEDNQIISEHTISEFSEIENYFNNITYAKGINNGNYVTLIKQDNALVGVICYNEAINALQ